MADKYLTTTSLLLHPHINFSSKAKLNPHALKVKIISKTTLLFVETKFVRIKLTWIMDRM